MLDNMNRLLERIDSLNKSFSSMVPKKAKQQQQTFADAMNEATKPANVTETKITEELKVDIKGLIDKYSQQHGLKPEVVQNLIAVASGNNPQAVGANGNLGLMQLKPEVFKDSGYTNPFDPEQNIMAGTKHLSSMLQRNGGDISLALAAYNSDPATVKRFGGVPPFADTQNFVGDVLSGLGKVDK